jgi:hypothetical protein
MILFKGAFPGNLLFRPGSAGSLKIGFAKTKPIGLPFIRHAGILATTV